MRGGTASGVFSTVENSFISKWRKTENSPRYRKRTGFYAQKYRPFSQSQYG
jgi:hypothetical protein